MSPEEMADYTQFFENWFVNNMMTEIPYVEAEAQS